jgi:SNF2 family DNA or RNA helicase
VKLVYSINLHPQQIQETLTSSTITATPSLSGGDLNLNLLNPILDSPYHHISASLSDSFSTSSLNSSPSLTPSWFLSPSPLLVGGQLKDYRLSNFIYPLLCSYFLLELKGVEWMVSLYNNSLNGILGFIL